VFFNKADIKSVIPIIPNVKKYPNNNVIPTASPIVRLYPTDIAGYFNWIGKSAPCVPKKII